MYAIRSAAVHEHIGTGSATLSHTKLHAKQVKDAKYRNIDEEGIRRLP